MRSRQQVAASTEVASSYLVGLCVTLPSYHPSTGEVGLQARAELHGVQPLLRVSHDCLLLLLHNMRLLAVKHKATEEGEGKGKSVVSEQ